MGKELTIHIKDTGSTKNGDESRHESINIQMDEDRIERLAAALGLLSEEAEADIKQSELEYRQGKARDFDEIIK